MEPYHKMQCGINGSHTKISTSRVFQKLFYHAISDDINSTPVSPQLRPMVDDTSVSKGFGFYVIEIVTVLNGKGIDGHIIEDGNIRFRFLDEWMHSEHSLKKRK